MKLLKVKILKEILNRYILFLLKTIAIQITFGQNLP